jgi:hypothetical protein
VAGFVAKFHHCRQYNYQIMNKLPEVFTARLRLFVAICGSVAFYKFKWHCRIKTPTSMFLSQPT